VNCAKSCSRTRSQTAVKKDLIKRLKNGGKLLRRTSGKPVPDWMILEVIPGHPAGSAPAGVARLRAIFATSDLNDLYRRLIKPQQPG